MHVYVMHLIYVHDDALAWWHSPEIGFSKAFLARFVKTGDSTKARAELASMQQNGVTVEAFAAKFFPIVQAVLLPVVLTRLGGATTQAGPFLSGL